MSNFLSYQVSLGPLMFASMFVLVGDHYQLPPLVKVHLCPCWGFKLHKFYCALKPCSTKCCMPFDF